MRNYILCAAAIAAVASAAPASAATALLTGASTTSGNSLLYSSGGVNFSVTGLTYGGATFSTATTPTVSRPGKYSQGLGIQPSGDDRHTVDNSKGWDFLLIRFDTAVALNGADFQNANWYKDNRADTDASISFATFGFTPALSYQTNLTGSAKTNFLNGVSASLGANMFSSNNAVFGNDPRVFNDGVNPNVSNVWIIGASIINADKRIDSFKLKSISWTIPVRGVPEPSTWAMLILGMGVVGGAMRRRTQAKIAFA